MSDSWFDYDEYLQPRHLKGKRVTLTIARASEVEVDERGNKKVKPVLYFKGTAKYLFLNKTARLALYEMFGENPAACAGKKIAIQAVPIKGRRDGKETIEIYAAPNSAPSSPLPKETSAQATVKPALDQLWDLAASREEPKDAVERLIRECGGDAVAALEALKTKYARDDASLAEFEALRLKAQGGTA